MRKDLKFLILLLVGLSFSVESFAQKLQQDPNLVKGTLKNGFTYYIYKNPKAAGQSVLRLFVNAGSLQEDEDQRGLAHFIEHMAFNGTTHYAKNDVIEFLESKGVKFGADLNAHTSFDETIYKISLNTKEEKNLEKAIDIMADWGFGITFDSLEIEKERGVVLEEWRSKQGADTRLREQYLPVLFSQSRYAERMPIGKVEVLKHAPKQRIVDFYKKWYRPDLMGIAIVTDIDPRLVESYIKKEFSQYKSAVKPSKAPRVYYDLPKHQDTLFSIITDKEARSVELSFFNKIPAFRGIRTQQDYDQQLVRMFFNGLVKQRFSRISQLQDSFKDGGFSVSNITLKNGVVAGGVGLYHDQITEGISSYLQEVQRIVRYGFTSQEVEKFKNEYISLIQRSLKNEDKTESSTYADYIRNDFYDKDVVQAKTERNNLALKLAPGIDSLRLINYLRSVYRQGNTVILLTGPENLAATLPGKERLKQLFAEARLKPVQSWKDDLNIPSKLLSQEPAAGKVIKEQRIPELDLIKWNLSNGTTVYLKKTTEKKNYISLSGFRDGGIYALDSNLFIASQFVKPVTGLSGAGEFSRAALTQFLTGNSASATLALSNTREGVVASSDWKDARTMFQLMYLKWMFPNADSVTFEQSKRKAIESAESAKLSPQYEYNKAISKLLKGEDDYPSDFSAERIKSELKFADLLPVFKSRFGSAKDFQFVVVGDFEADSIRPLIEQYIGGLPAGEYKKDYEYKGPVGGDEQKDVLIYAGQAPKSTVNLFYQSNSIKHDYPEIAVEKLLQEVLKVKLRLNLREQNSGVYGVGVAISSTSKPSPLIRTRISFTCAPEVAEFLTQQAKLEIEKVAKDPDYFKAELANIKVQEIEGYKKDKEKNLFWSAGLRNQFYYGFKDYTYLNSYEALIEKISAKDIASFAKKYLVNTPAIKAVLMPENFKTLN